MKFLTIIFIFILFLPSVFIGIKMLVQANIFTDAARALGIIARNTGRGTATLAQSSGGTVFKYNKVHE